MPNGVRNLLASLDPELWAEIGFEPWEWQGLAGVHRHMIFRKGGFLGEVARYFAEDYLVWSHRGKIDEDRLLSRWPSAPDVISHRFLLLDEVTVPRRSRAFLLGLRGWVDVQRYRPGEEPHRKFRDLARFVDEVALCVRRRRAEERGGDSLSRN